MNIDKYMERVWIIVVVVFFLIMNFIINDVQRQKKDLCTHWFDKGYARQPEECQ